MARRRSRQSSIDPLIVALVVGMLVTGMVAVTDIIRDGMLDPTIVALLVSTIGPLTPALIIRQRHQGDDDEDGSEG